MEFDGTEYNPEYFRKENRIKDYLVSEDLIDEIFEVAESGILPDGDGVNMPTMMWLESWIERQREGKGE